MTTQIMYDKGLRCKGRGFNCEGCRDKNTHQHYNLNIKIIKMKQVLEM